ncbi:unnamed protein product [Rotaria sordida]|uniref:HAT C-terminal dimerisation domain-containing protein n=1 Tax=Rotaria sordida TaxID=392033 RepID=A0A815N5Y1_9BILA|nr:unnamed protein product [Rotaria sordida]CAF3714069.1 unnamed protein product [Rotaria sordida]
MYNSNIDNPSDLVKLPPRGSSDRSQSQIRTSRSSTLNRSLHRTLSNEIVSSSITRRSKHRSSSGRSHNRKVVGDPNIDSTNVLLSSNKFENNVQGIQNLDQNDEMITIESGTDVLDRDYYQNQNSTTDSVQLIHPFEVDKVLPPKITTTSSGKKKAEDVLKFFEMQSDGMYKCLLCVDEQKIIRQCKRSTANLRSHLLVHGMNEYAFKSQEDQQNSKKNTTSVISLSLQRKHEIDEALLQCIIGAGLPYNMFNHNAVIQFLHVLEPGYTPPDRRTLSSRIISEYNEYVNDLKSILPHIGPLAFASDIWKDISRHHMISLSIHTFTFDFEYISLPISFHIFHERELSVNIRGFFEHERDRFNLNTRILAGITTDNGPNIKSAASYNILGPRFACLAHCLNLTVHHALCLWTKPDPKKYPFDSAHHEVTDSLIDDEDDELTSDLPEFISSISLGGENSIADDNQNLVHLNHTSSYSDNLSSSSFVQTKDYLDIELSEDNSQIVNPRNNEEIYKFLLRVYALLRKVRIFISMAREVAALQRHVHNKLGDNKGGFILDVKIRWSSSFAMLDRFINLRDLVEEIFYKRDINGLTTAQQVEIRALFISHDDWDVLVAVHDCLKPFEKATTMLSGQYPTQSLAYFSLEVIKAGVQKPSYPSYYHALANESLRLEYQYYLDEFLPDEQKDWMKIAAFLDPMFHLDLMRNDIDYQYTKQLIINKMKNMDLIDPFPRQKLPTTATSASSVSLAERMSAFKTSLLNSVDVKISSSLSSQPLSIDSEIFTFLNLVRENEGVEFQSFWKVNHSSLPRLSQMARIFNVVPATSTYLEQMFSVAGAVKNIRRASLSSLSLRSLIMLRKKKELDKLRAFIHQ